MSRPTHTQEVVIPASGFPEVDNEGGPHLAVYAHATDHTPALRIRIGDGPGLDRVETVEALIDAAKALRAQLVDEGALL